MMNSRNDGDLIALHGRRASISDKQTASGANLSSLSDGDDSSGRSPSTTSRTARPAKQPSGLHGAAQALIDSSIQKHGKKYRKLKIATGDVVELQKIIKDAHNSVSKRGIRLFVESDSEDDVSSIVLLSDRLIYRLRFRTPNKATCRCIPWKIS